MSKENRRKLGQGNMTPQSVENFLSQLKYRFLQEGLDLSVKASKIVKALVHEAINSGLRDKTEIIAWIDNELEKIEQEDLKLKAKKMYGVDGSIRSNLEAFVIQALENINESAT